VLTVKSTVWAGCDYALCRCGEWHHLHDLTLYVRIGGKQKALTVWPGLRYVTKHALHDLNVTVHTEPLGFDQLLYVTADRGVLDAQPFTKR